MSGLAIYLQNKNKLCKFCTCINIDFGDLISVRVNVSEYAKESESLFGFALRSHLVELNNV